MVQNNFFNISLIIISGLSTSLKIFIITLIFSIPLGTIIALFKDSKNVIISTLIKIYILLIRGTPMILQIIFVYFAPYYLFKITYDRFTAIIIAFACVMVLHQEGFGINWITPVSRDF